MNIDNNILYLNRVEKEILGLPVVNPVVIFDDSDLACEYNETTGKLTYKVSAEIMSKLHNIPIIKVVDNQDSECFMFKNNFRHPNYKADMRYQQLSFNPYMADYISFYDLVINSASSTIMLIDHHYLQSSHTMDFYRVKKIIGYEIKGIK